MLTTTELQLLGQRHLPEFRAFALRLTADRDRAEDLIQDTLYLALKYRTSFQIGSNFRAWIKTIIRNTFISDYRRTKRRRDLLREERISGGYFSDRIIQNPAESNLGAEEIMKLIEEMPKIYRRAFLLFFQGMKYQEIAKLTGVPVGTAKSRVFTARKSLKALLIERGITN